MWGIKTEENGVVSIKSYETLMNPTDSISTRMTRRARVGIVSFDFDGTLTNYFELASAEGVKTFSRDMYVLRECLRLMKEFEDLDKVYLSLNTNEGRTQVLEKAFANIFTADTPWLVPGLNFLAGSVRSYCPQTYQMSEPLDFGNLYKRTHKLTKLEEFALMRAADEELISVTHIEDGKDYDETSFAALNEVSVNNYIVNLPQHAGRAQMLAALRATAIARQVKERDTQYSAH